MMSNSPSPKVTWQEPEQPRSPSPDIILRRDNDFFRSDHAHEWDDDDTAEDEDVNRKVPDIQKDDLASRRARMNQPRPSGMHRFLPSSCSKKDRERWEGIMQSSQHALLESAEKIKLEQRCVEWKGHHWQIMVIDETLVYILGGGGLYSGLQKCRLSNL